MNKILLLITLFCSTGFLNAIDIKTMQEEFYKNTVKLNIKNNTFKSDYKKKLRLHSLYTNIDNKYIKRLEIKVKYMLLDKNINENEFISVVDLKKQLFILLLKTKNKFSIIGVDLISSGEINKEVEVVLGEDHYFKTPAGVYSIKSGWRSDGTFKEDNVTLKYGLKDRFIYYIGMVDTVRYNTFTKDGTKLYDKEQWKLLADKVNLAMHSYTQSSVLGVKDSHGCIRISNELNDFLDKNNVLYKNFYKKDKWSLRYSKQPKTSKNKNLAGEYLIIFDKI